MHLSTPANVHFCFLGERCVFLDLERDRYFAASPDATQALVRAIDGCSILGADEMLLQPLLNEGLLALVSEPFRPLAPTAMACAKGEVDAGSSPRPLLVASALVREFRAYRQLRRLGLAAVVATRSQGKGLATNGLSVETIAAAFRASNLISSAHERCLIKSIALFDLLFSNGHRPMLVLGVRDFPFTAHAWVQLDDQVVGDRLERILLYRPILAV